MRYGAIPEGLLEHLALVAGRAPMPLLDTIFPLLRARALMAGVELGLFEELAGNSRTAAEVAAARDLDPEVTLLLLRTLAWSGYLAAEGDRFALTAIARRTALAGAPGDLTALVRWNQTQWAFFERLEGLARSGRGLDFHRGLEEPEAWATYQRGMLQTARYDAAAVARRVPVRSGARRLLDVAGSHGLLGAAICRRHPPMRSTVLDLPIALETARALAVEAGIAELVEHRSGDLEVDPWPADNDVVLLANILHHYRREGVLAALARARAALVPGGTVAIWEIERPRADAAPEAGDAVALFFRLTSTGSCHSGDELVAWLTESGFTAARAIRPWTTPGRVLVVAQRS